MKKRSKTTSANELLARIAVRQIENDLIKMGGLSPLLWSDREHREKLIERWEKLVYEVIK